MKKTDYNNLKEIILISSKTELEKYINKLSENELNYFLDNLLPKLIEETSINKKNNINEHNIEKIVNLLNLDIDYNFNKINTILKNNKVISKKPRYFNYLEVINDINCAEFILNKIDKSLFYEAGSFTHKLNFIDALFSNKKNKDFVEYYYNKYSNEIFNNLKRNTVKNHDKYKLNLDVKDKFYNKIFNNRFNFKFINNFLENLNNVDDYVKFSESFFNNVKNKNDILVDILKTIFLLNNSNKNLNNLINNKITVLIICFLKKYNEEDILNNKDEIIKIKEMKNIISLGETLTLLKNECNTLLLNNDKNIDLNAVLKLEKLLIPKSKHNEKVKI